MRAFKAWIIINVFFIPGLVFAQPEPEQNQPEQEGSEQVTEQSQVPEQESSSAKDFDGEALYKRLQKLSINGHQGNPLFGKLDEAARTANWSSASSLETVGSLRFMKNDAREEQTDAPGLYLVRDLKSSVWLVDMSNLPEGVTAQSLRDLKGARVQIVGTQSMVQHDGQVYPYLRLSVAPKKQTIDVIFRICIIAMLFFVMLGMGLTLKYRDFAMVVMKPRAMIIGPICQFGVLPLIAYGLGHLAGYPEEFPFLFIGLILIASSPGGVTSNLLTYLGRGDLALSVSMTAISTVASLFFTPFLLQKYGGGIEGVNMPAGQIASIIAVMVIVPLGIGMTIRHFKENWAKKSEKFFSGLGVFSLLFLIIAGLIGNHTILTDFSRYGLKFYGVILGLTLSSMIFSMLVARLFRVNNFQTRAITLETGLQNASLAMTIALLLQDSMGDFHGSMFAVSGLYGLWMYVAGALIISSFRFFLPVDHSFNVSGDAAES